MQFSDLSSIIKVAAPLLGTVIGGPFGATIGTIVAGVFGGSTPMEVASNIQSDPDSVSKLQQIEYEHQQALSALASQQETNAQDARQFTTGLGKAKWLILGLSTFIVLCLISLVYLFLFLSPHVNTQEMSLLELVMPGFTGIAASAGALMFGTIKK